MTTFLAAVLIAMMIAVAGLAHRAHLRWLRREFVSARHWAQIAWERLGPYDHSTQYFIHDALKLWSRWAGRPCPKIDTPNPTPEEWEAISLQNSLPAMTLVQ